MTLIRPAAEADLPAVHALDAELFGAAAWSAATVAAELIGSDRIGMVAVEGFAAASVPAGVGLVGYLAAMTVDEMADLNRIAVAVDHRRRGIAAALLAEATEVARQRGMRRMLLEVSETNTGALAFYRRSGFAEISRRPRYYPDGSGALILERPLPGPELVEVPGSWG